MISTMPGRKPKKPKTGWAKTLSTKRRKTGLTQQQAAALVGIPFRTWRSWENEQRTPHSIVQQYVLSKLSAKS